MGLRERWQSGKPETLVLAGCVVAFGGNCGFLLWAILASPPAEWAAPLAAASSGLALSVVLPLVLSRTHARTAKHFGLVGLVASAIALFTWPGVVGGGIALVGAVWGILATYEGM